MFLLQALFQDMKSTRVFFRYFTSRLAESIKVLIDMPHNSSLAFV